MKKQQTKTGTITIKQCNHNNNAVTSGTYALTAAPFGSYETCTASVLVPAPLGPL